MTASALVGQLLRWPISKETQSLRIFVVEPAKYDVTKHKRIFNGTLNALLRPDVGQDDQYGQRSNLAVSEPFDLVTFPEAFLPTKDLVEALTLIAENGELGCIHVGLRSSADEGAHLVGVPEFKSLVADLSSISGVEVADLATVKSWLNAQNHERRFNVGCLFSIDASGMLRICLHPKMVRSKFEIGVVADDHMTQGSILSVVTLLPESKKFLSVTLQPIICSDALQLHSDTPGRMPLQCLNSDDANVFSETLPDHIDIVSVATCTPQAVGMNASVPANWMWHDEFCATFRQIGTGGQWHRHVHATFVLSNFLQIPAGSTYGGLSGGFLPMPYRHSTPLPSFMSVCAYGKLASEAHNRWGKPAQELEPSFKSLGYIAHLSPELDPPYIARMLGFTINPLPRNAPHWTAPSSLAPFELRTGSLDPDSDEVIFKKERSNV